MSPNARSAARAYANLLAQDGCSSCFEEFFWHGSDTWSGRRHHTMPALSLWHGPDDLKKRLACQGGIPGAEVRLASRSQTLMQMALSILCDQCQTILTTDAEWPAYSRMLDAEAARTRTEVVRVHIAQYATSGRQSLADALIEQFDRQNCDGLFLSALTYPGLHLPVPQICQAVKERLQFSVVDAAQAFSHIDTSAGELMIAGSHKWLSSGAPLGIAFSRTHRAAELLDSKIRQACGQPTSCDPLLRFLEGERESAQSRYHETVNVEPLFLCRAALLDASDFLTSGQNTLNRRIQNAQTVTDLAQASGWKPIHKEQTTGILTLQANSTSVRSAAANVIRDAFQGRHVSVTAYDEGIIRMSMPVRALVPNELRRIQRTMHRMV